MTALALPLYLSALALVAVIGLVAMLYWIKPPPRTVVVPSGLLWDRVLRESHPRPDRMRWWLSMLLAALIAAAIVSSVLLFRPAGPATGAPGLVVVIDNSPTMATRTTDGATRWDHALDKARNLIEGRDTDTGIWLADTMRRIVTPSFQYRQDALAQLARLRVSYGSQPTVPLPEQSVDVDTVVITDGVSIGPVPARARLESVFESVENAGITAFEVRALPAEPRRYLAYVEVINASGIEKRVDLAIAGTGDRSVSRMVPIPAGSSRVEMIDISDFESGPLRASIAMPGDGLATDDVAYAFLPAHRAMRVGLVTEGNPFLYKSLLAQPRVKMTVITPAHYIGDRGFDAVIFDRFAPKARPGVPALLFRPAGVDWLPLSQKDISDVSVTAWNAAHPLLENISLSDVSIAHASVVDLNGQSKDSTSVLASGARSIPLIVAHEDAPRWVAFSFSLQESNFALQAGFPIFLSNALQWLRTGQTVVARGLGLIEVPVSGARVITADGKELPSQSIARGSLFDADTPGLFMVVSARQRLWVAANLFDRRISEVNRSHLAPIAPGVDASGGAPQFSPIDTTIAFLLTAALLLLFEWWSWNRRMTV